MILSDLLPDVLGRIEENSPTDAQLPGPTFWNLNGEVYQQMVDAMFEAALITGVVQLSSIAVTLAAETTYFTLQYGTNAPKGILAPIRLRAPYPIRKVTQKGLDDMVPTWQQATPGTQLIAWFPLGVSQFGIYPQLSAESQVVMDFISSPVNQARPYSGNVGVPFQVEFSDFLSQYAAAMCRAKEGGAEAEEAQVVYQDYLAKMKQLSAFQGRLDSLVFTGAFGGRGLVNPRTAV
jgi:hypothetical protein